jgi:hypothetical protein
MIDAPPSSLGSGVDKIKIVDGGAWGSQALMREQGT